MLVVILSIATATATADIVAMTMTMIRGVTIGVVFVVMSASDILLPDLNYKFQQF